MELKTVGECRDVSASRASGENCRRSAPQWREKWQLAHTVLQSAEARVSQKSARPSYACGVDGSPPALIWPKSAAASRRKASSALAASAATIPNASAQPARIVLTRASMNDASDRGNIPAPQERRCALRHSAALQYVIG